MKVLILGYFPEDIENPYGGIEAVLVELYKEFRKKYSSDRFIFCTIKHEITENRIVNDGNMEVRYYKSPPIPQTVNNFTFEFVKSLQIIREIKPDIINAHNISGYSLAAVCSGYPHVITPHGDMLAELELNTRNSYYKPIKRIFWKILILILFRFGGSFSWIGEYYRAKFEKNVSSRKNFMIGNPVSVEYYGIKRSESQEPVLLYATRIIKGKNIELAFEVVVRLSKKFPGIRFILAGKTDSQFEADFGELVKKYASYIDRNIFLVGHLNRKELLNYYRECWLYFHPSLQEISSTSIIQALASGVPVIAGNIPGNQNLVIHGKNGYLCTADDISQFSDFTGKLLSNKRERAEFGNAGKKFALKFRSSIIAGNYMQCYSEILNQSAREIN